MARNPLRRPPPPPVPKVIGPVPVIASLLVAGAVLAIGIPWLASSPDAGHELARPAPEAALAPVQTGVDDTGSLSRSETVPAAVRAFLDPADAGAIAYAAGNYETALAQYLAAIEQNPQDAESHSNLGQMLVRLKRPEESLPHFERAIELMPERWAYHFNHARALGLLARWDEAVAGYRRAMQIFPEDYATAFNLGQALHRQGDEAGAVEAYLRAIELDATDPTFRMALGISYESLQKPADAAAAYIDYLRLSPDAADAEKVRARIERLSKTGS